MPPLLTTVALVALGGALGTVARVWLGEWIGTQFGPRPVAPRAEDSNRAPQADSHRAQQADSHRAPQARPQPAPLPVGTIFVNLSGALAVGLVAGSGHLGSGYSAGSGWAFVITGVLGSFTTVSSLALQTVGLAETGYPRRAALNLGLTLLAGLAAVTLGYAAGAQLWGTAV